MTINAPWLETAQRTIGTKEVPGPKNNPVIMGWAAKVARFLGIAYTADSIPWCAMWLSWVMDQNGITPPKISVRASSWGTWGRALSEPTPGAILVFTREGGGHVGFYLSEDATTYHVLGANQGDAVSITRILKTRCSAIRWPHEAALPKTGRKIAVFNGKLSANEA